MLSSHIVARDPENDDEGVVAFRCYRCMASIKFARPGGEGVTVTDDGSGDFFPPADVDSSGAGPCPGATQIISKDDFITRLTDAEVVALLGSWDEKCKVMVARFDHKEMINLDSPILIAFLGYCETIDCLAVGRAAEILAH